MSQATQIIADGTGAQVLTELNNALAAQTTNFSGTAAPSPTAPYMLWADTTNNLLKMRNGADTAWITLGDSTAANLGLATLALSVARTSATGSAVLPSSTTANRDGSPAVGYLRYNTTLNQFEGYGSAGWGKVGGGTTGAGTDAAFYENDTLITGNYTIGQSGLISGATVTIATPGVVTLNSHGFVANQLVFFETTGALPTGLLVDKGYYVISTGLTTNAFQLSLTQGGAAINTSGTQSGVHSCGKIKNAETAGTVVVNDGVTVSIPTGATWSIV